MAQINSDQLRVILDKFADATVGHSVDEAIAGGLAIAYMVQNPYMNMEQMMDAIDITSKFVKFQINKYIHQSHPKPTPKEQVN